MKILVTGATGLLGYAVAALLVEPGHQVTGLIAIRHPRCPQAFNGSTVICAHPRP